jgi:hypothetical protein
MEGTEWTKVNHTHMGIHGETNLNIDLDIDNERRDCKIGKVCVWGECLWG